MICLNKKIIFLHEVRVVVTLSSKLLVVVLRIELFFSSHRVFSFFTNTIYVYITMNEYLFH